MAAANMSVRGHGMAPWGSPHTQQGGSGASMPRGSCSMLPGTRRSLAVAMATMTEELTSPAASPGSRSMPNLSCRSWVPLVCPDATETQGKLSPVTLPHCPKHLQPRSTSPLGSLRAGTPQSTPPPHPAHRLQPGPPTGPGAALPRNGWGRVTTGPAVAACRLPCGPQMGPVVPGFPAGAGSQRSPHGAGSACSPLTLVCKAPRKDC